MPVFNDKQLSYDWNQSRQMVDWSRELNFPLMAGSSVSVTFRRPELDFPLETPMQEAMAVGGGWVADGGLFHLLETLQCFAERRQGGETGVKAVQLLTDEAVWKAAAEGRFSRAPAGGRPFARNQGDAGAGGGEGQTAGGLPGGVQRRLSRQRPGPGRQGGGVPGGGPD